MSVESIFCEIATHQLNGLMVHAEYANYFGFLGLEGYRHDHECQYEEELQHYRDILHFYLDNYNKLLPLGKIHQPLVIPKDWYKYTRFDVTEKDIRNGVKQGLEHWHDWETTTLELYRAKGKELNEMMEASAVKKVMALIEDVEEEIHRIEKWMLEKNAADYSMESIQADQKKFTTKKE